MIYNKKLQISTGNSRKSIVWQRTTLFWSELAERLKTPVRGVETLEQYLKLSKAKQDELKDVGGFVGGTFRGDRRKAASVETRSIITLDLDNIPCSGTEDILKRVSGLGCAALVYSTRKHSEYAPRLRVLIPLDQDSNADEYEPAARKLASLVGIQFCDATTFEASRLMYYPSCCSDSTYVFQIFDNPFCSLQGLLGMYADWRDVSSWPQVPGVEAIEKRRVAKQEDPTTKKGIVGIFCRTYSITQAMAKFLPGIYEETDIAGRYTYTGGSTAGGAILYENDSFLYSHHATDPCSGKLVNAFDLVRLHKYADLDDEVKEGTPVAKMPSYREMAKLAINDNKVSEKIALERYEQAKLAFGESSSNEGEAELSWISKLSRDGNGKIEKTINNAVLILENDPLLKGKIVTDEFANCGMVLGSLPWNASKERRRWRDVDDAGFYRYMETFYGLTGRDKLDNALLIASEENKINDVKQYLVNLKWDGIRRIDTLLNVYLGAEDNAYTQAVMRKSLCAAVARAVDGGVKFDNMPIFTGPQGIGKSTFIGNLGLSWFSDSLTTFEGKEAAEMIQGTWINEIGELSAFSRQETQIIKQFLSKREDIYRAAYGRRTEKYPRRCIFFGTSNDIDFLRDTTGNRRFWPVDVGLYPAKKSVWDDMPSEVDQIWAEAYVCWQQGEKLYLSKEIEKMAELAQEHHREVSVKEGIIREFIEKDIPPNWDSFSIQKRKIYWQGGIKVPDDVSLVKRNKICAIEIWVECLNGDSKYIKRSDSSEINGILASTDGWKRNSASMRFGPYGVQKGFKRLP